MPDLITLTAPAESEFTIQRSRFITHTFPVKTEEDAQTAVKLIKKQYFDARHNCFAFRLGREGIIQRSNDDGEPGGTAGAPILDAIIRNELTDILIVVTRYFGGIKLGAGGLTRAYSHAAMLGINASPLARSVLFERWSVTVPYPLLGSLENYLHKKNIRLEDSLYAENVTLKLLLEPADAQVSITDMINLTAAVANCEKETELVLQIPLEKCK